jgi:hypothetical protein
MPWPLRSALGLSRLLKLARSPAGRRDGGEGVWRSEAGACDDRVDIPAANLADFVGRTARLFAAAHQ